MEGLISSLLSHAQRRRAEGGKQAKELMVVNVDHRNHGSRLVDVRANLGWARGQETHNEKHAIDMFAIYTGTSRDVSFLIDFLPAYVFPNGEREIIDWGVIGVSLGGHSTWTVLMEDTRVTMGVPIIGCPDYLSLMEERAKEAGMAPGPPVIPKHLQAYITKHSPTSSGYDIPSELNPFFNKDILVLSGAADNLVPWSHCKPFVDALVVGEKGRKRVVLQTGAGHELTPEMIAEAAEFVWQWIVEAPADESKF
ncbi:hypothetical protein FRB97_000301 [Tulasnella sp. 331]|nr:hypothetical protein FRB97_000301 [Tulasnella sp. 331]